MKRLLISAVGIALTLQAGSALAYQDVGFDPDDRAVVGGDPDIRSTARVVWTDRGLRWLKVRFTAYEPLSFFWRVKARLDSRGGRRVDYVIELWNADNSGRGCAVHRQGQTNGDNWVRANFRQVDDDTARCVVRLYQVRPTKRIRWRLRSPSGYGAEADLAPNSGFYPS
jgi:hypothetical protein